MTPRHARPLWAGVAASVLLHALVLGGVNWTLPQWQDASPFSTIEARLLPPPAPVRPASPARLPEPPRPKPVAPPAPPPAPAAPEVVVEARPIPEVVEAEPVAVPEPEAPEPEAAEQPAPVPAAEEPPPLNPLPRRIDMEYRISIGPASGRQNLVWVNEGERYTVTSVTAATGFASLIYSGRFVQTSSGQVTPRGLVPQAFWDQRGDKHSSARFDQGQLTLTPSSGAIRHFAYPDGVQDTLSLLFQLALTAPPPEGPIAYTVFNGKKLRDYAYEVRGETTLETALGPLRTLHLARRMSSDGRFEVWLAIDRHYLPVRVLRVDDSGVEGELAIVSFAFSD
ncbi:MAG: DUF3108 domain-containing protein [Thiobacillus sp.]|uniref:DUF3108 domain-containing protein n=1 Tax=Thiobacillus sp. TaxID=924 RepID=UPI0028961961|nr:DUF3108 domain-containing protein [Thiobacillus sp.]MDT3705955.1 DUF3108 domain-containing protein [Thiobacillus sp.]